MPAIAGLPASGHRPAQKRRRCARWKRECARSGRCHRGNRGGHRLPRRRPGPPPPPSRAASQRSNGTTPDAVEAGHHRRRVPQQLHGAAGVAGDGIQPPPELLDHGGVHVEHDTARPDHAPPKTVAAEQGRDVEHVAAEASAIGQGGQEAHVARQRAQIADMVGNPFQLQGHAAEELPAGRHAGCAEGLHGAAVGGRMSGGAVAGQGLGVMDRARTGSAQHRPFHAAMLVAQGDFQMVDRLTMALEAEMAGLDNASVDRTDRDLMDLLARHVKEVDLAALQCTLTPCPSPRGRGEPAALTPGHVGHRRAALVGMVPLPSCRVRQAGEGSLGKRTGLARDDPTAAHSTARRLRVRRGGPADHRA